MINPAPEHRSEAGRTLDTPCTITTWTNLDEWVQRAAALRQQVLMAAGLWPLPERTPLDAQVYERTYHAGYTVEKVYFASLPGFYVTGNLYRPIGDATSPRAAILNPHGHWTDGRFHHDHLASIPSRCITFARLGYVAFTYDMLSYGDSWQVVHRYTSLANSLWGISPLGLQLWNSIRAVDFLAGLPDVDPLRLGCTGESGGGTQTFLLTTVDDRIKVSAPVNMISAHFQGGCVCENAPGLRIGTNNVELAATMAPRPMLLVSATGDWTVNTPKVEYPAIRAVYELFGAADRVACTQIDAEHNYNKESRAAVYNWFLRWLPPTQEDADQCGAQHGELEGAIQPPPDEQLQVFAAHPRPVQALDQDGVFGSLVTRSQQMLDHHCPDTPDRLASFRAIYGPLWRQLFPAVDVAASGLNHQWAQPHEVAKGIWQLHIGPEACAAIAPAQQPQELHFYTTYQHSDAALLVRDIASIAARVTAQAGVTTLQLVGEGVAGLPVLCAAALLATVEPSARPKLQVDVDLPGLSWQNADFISSFFVPGIRQAGDVRTAVALLAPTPLNIAGVQNLPTGSLAWFSTVYNAANAAANLAIR